MKSKTKIHIGFSPCPNDTFIFDALVNHKIDTGELEFIPVLDDVESLNKNAFSMNLDVSKLSFYAYAHLSKQYQLLDAGAALGRGAGPLLVAKKKVENPEQEIHTVAIPGKYTTANFLLSLFFPGMNNKTEMIFSEIEDAVLNDSVDAGLLIHESRFTYEKKGLVKLRDLGELWEKDTGLPVPLGGIAVRRDLSNEIKSKINLLVRKSLEYAFANPESSREYIRTHAQEMDEEITQKHINLYVNSSSLALGKEERDSINTLYRKAQMAGLVSELVQPVFLED